MSPVEIENIIYKIPGIKEVAVTGFPDPVLGESIMAFVTIHENINLSEDEIIQVCTAHLELFMIPQRVFFLNEMPKSLNGKIDKKELMKRI